MLVVDDEPDLCEIFEQWLVDAGCKRVTIAGNGEIALARLGEERFDLMVTDVHMPVVDGIKLIRTLEALNSHLPSVIFISGFGDVDKTEMYARGVEAFLAKPIRRDELIGIVEQALAERSALWLAPMDVAPKQAMAVEVEGIGASFGTASLHLGRGGFSVHYAGSLSLGKVTFRCRIAQAEREMAGEGYVRWRSKADSRVGIEFAYVQPECRKWVLDAIAAAAPRSFIPG